MKPLGELGKFKNGINKGKEDFGHGFPFVNLMDVFGIPKVSAATTDFGLVNTTAAEQDLYELREGDVLFVRSSVKPEGVGLTTLIPQDLPNTVFSGFLIRFRDSGLLELGFKEHCFWDEGFRARLISNSTVSANTNINQDALKRLLIAFPPTFTEQRSISTALSDMDVLLVGLDQLIAKKRDLKQAAIQQLLTGKKRLPGFEGKWEKTTLGEIGECIIGLTYKPENVVEHGLLVLRSSNIQNGQLVYDDNVYVNIEVPDHLVTRTGDILVCVRNGSRALIGKCAVINESAAGLTFGAFMSIYRTEYWRFIAHAFQAHGIQRQIRDNIGATINQITNKDMKAFRVLLPPEDEQNEIAAVLSDMDAEIAVLEQRRDKTRALKQGMMQELLTGRTRLV